MIPKYPLATSSWDQAEYDALDRVIKSNQFSMGPEVRAFEEQFARQFGSRYAVMVNSGSSANLLIIAALRYTQNDKIKILEGAEIGVAEICSMSFEFLNHICEILNLAHHQQLLTLMMMLLLMMTGSW